MYRMGRAVTHLRPGKEVVEYVEVSLALGLLHHSALLQQVLGDLHSHDATLCIKEQSRVLPEAARVVVHNCLGITKGLQQRAYIDNLLFQATRAALVWATQPQNVTDDVLRAFRLACPRLAADDHTLIFLLA